MTSCAPAWFVVKPGASAPSAKTRVSSLRCIYMDHVLNKRVKEGVEHLNVQEVVKTIYR
jgi:hypothetical protein